MNSMRIARSDRPQTVITIYFTIDHLVGPQHLMVFMFKVKQVTMPHKTPRIPLKLMMNRVSIPESAQRVLPSLLVFFWRRSPYERFEAVISNCR